MTRAREAAAALRQTLRAECPALLQHYGVLSALAVLDAVAEREERASTYADSVLRAPTPPHYPVDDATGRAQALHAEVESQRRRFDAALGLFWELETLVYESSRWLNDSTLWENDETLGPRWQDIRNRAGKLGG